MDLALARGLSWRDRAPTYRRPGMHHASDERTRHRQCGEHVCHPSLSVQMAVHGSGGSFPRENFFSNHQHHNKTKILKKKKKKNRKKKKKFFFIAKIYTPTPPPPPPPP